MVEHLIALWPTAQLLAKRPCDPLDPDLVDYLEQNL